MSGVTNKPVIFLAFANDRDYTVGYLRNLPDEARRLRDVLEPAEQAGLCEVVVRSNSTAGDIFKVFQDRKYRNRIAIFHYGGHANGYELLLESPEGKAAVADAGGLAAFLAQQQGMELVFLSRDGRLLASVSMDDESIRIWDKPAPITSKKSRGSPIMSRSVLLSSAMSHPATVRMKVFLRALAREKEIP